MKTIEKTTEQAYIEAYNRAIQALRDLENRIHDMPAPDGETPINWEHVGDINRIFKAVSEI